MHPINEWEGSSYNLFWIVASEHSAMSVIETTGLFNPYSTAFIGYYSK